MLGGRGGALGKTCAPLSVEMIGEGGGALGNTCTMLSIDMVGEMSGALGEGENDGAPEISPDSGTPT